MSTLRDLVEEHTTLGPIEVDHLYRLAGDWQLIADLSFADLLLWVAVEPPRRQPADARPQFLCVAQVRPTTAPTAYQDDSVGRIVTGPEAAHLAIAHSQGRIWREGDPVWYGDTPARHEAIPVRRRDGVDVIAVVGRDTNLSTARTPSQLEMNYLTTADDLAQMVADGTFPAAAPPGRDDQRAAGRRRPDPPRRQRQGLLRQPERPVGVPAPGPRRAPGRRGPGRGDQPADRRPAGGRRRGRPDPGRAARGGARRARRSRPAARPCCSGRCRCCRPGCRSARWCWCATSPRSAAGTGS